MPEQLLFQQDLIFKENFLDMDEAFAVMGKRFLDRGLVKPAYIAAIKAREQEYPTGIDLSVIGADLPSVAIPHTQSEYCQVTAVILVKLKQAICVRNMMNPAQTLNNVRYLFMILNGWDVEQTGILSKIMGIVTNADNIKALDKADTIEQLYEVVKNEIL